MEGYNEKYPSGLRKVTCWPPFNITFAFDTFKGRPNPFAAAPMKIPNPEEENVNLMLNHN